MKEYLKDRIILIRASIVNTFQRDFAYAFNNWGNIVSATMYMLVTIVFIEVLYSNVDFIAGYNRNEMLLLIFIGQIIFYLTWIFSLRNIMDLIESVNSGGLDLVLTKPIPSLFYVSTKTIDIFSITRDTIIGMTAIFISIDWASLNLKLENIIIGLCILILGFIISHVIHFLCALPVFWLGESEALLQLSLTLDFDVLHGIPFEGLNFSKVLQIFFLTFLPFLYAVGVSTSVILGKSNPLLFLILSITIAFLALRVKSWAWNLALRNYTSASS